MAGTAARERFREPMVERSRFCAGATDIGKVRRRNEDAYWVSPDGSALVVADGLGGLPAGDVASALAVGAVAEFLEQDARPEKLPNLPNPRVPSNANDGGPAPDLARAAAARAQLAVLEAARDCPAWRGMATTLLVVLVRGSAATVLQVGDSRAALWRNGRFVCSTIDQNEAGDLVRAGAITVDEARVHPGRNRVREVIGLPHGYEAECQTWNLEAGDVLLVVTDGVSEAVPEREITAVLSASSDAAKAAASLVTSAAVAGRDNATAIVCRVT